MISSSSSITKTLPSLISLACAAVVFAARAETPVPSPLAGVVRVAVFPIENLTAGGVPEAELQAAIARAISRAGFDVVAGDLVELFLAARRIRYTGGLSREVAKAAREQLGADGVLLATLEQGRAGELRMALNMRLVTTSDPPAIAWMDGFARTGDDAPGLLGLGLITDPARLRDQALETLARSLADARGRGGPPGVRCQPGKTYAPKFSFRLPALDAGSVKTVAVLPFVNTTKRQNAGEIARLEVLRQFAAVPGLRIVDPGEIREALLSYRIILRGGVSLISARTMLNTLRADWVVVGEVRRFDEERAAAELNLHILDRAGENVIWQSRSYNDGSDGVRFFNLGRVSTSTALVCRMASEVMERALHDRASRLAAQGSIRPPESK